MNNKRQTIWLVSMLSLMVVLSAYYLFTEDVNNLDLKTTGASTKEISIGAGASDTTQKGNASTPAKDGKHQQNPSTDSTRSEQKAEQKTEPKAEPKAEPSKKNDTPSSANPNSKNDTQAAQPVSKSANQSTGSTDSADAKVLQQMQTQAKSGGDYFLNLQLKRHEETSKQVEQLMTIIADPKQTADAAVKAQEDLNKIEEMEAKITNLEESLMKDFPQAVVIQESSKWKVAVQTNKLQKSQALSIMDKTMKELNLTPDKISVQMVP